MSIENGMLVVVLTTENKLVHAGDPESIGKKQLGQYAIDGYAIKHIHIDEYRATQWKWHWEK